MDNCTPEANYGEKAEGAELRFKNSGKDMNSAVKGFGGTARNIGYKFTVDFAEI